MTADNAGFKTTGNTVISGVVPFGIAGWVRFILPVAMLRLVESAPGWDILTITANNKCCVAKEVVNNLSICPSAIEIEESQRGI